MRRGERVLGPRLFSGLLRPTFYRQFVGGDTQSELTRTIEKLSAANLRLMVCPVQEEDVGESSGDECVVSICKLIFTLTPSP